MFWPAYYRWVRQLSANSLHLSRRSLLQSGVAVASLAALERTGLAIEPQPPLQEFAYDQIAVRGSLQLAQQKNVSDVLLGLDPDSLLKPFREMSGKPGPGASLGGWYEWNPTYDYHHSPTGLCPGATFGQWTSALARLQAGSRFDGKENSVLADRVHQLHALLAESVGPGYFAQTRFPAYSLDKLTCGLMDAHHLLHDSTALATLDQLTAAAQPSLPGHAMEREIQWKVGRDLSWMWDETYTMPENLYLVSSLGGGARYRKMAEDYLLNSWFEPLSRGENVLGDLHAYSHVNSLCSAMQAWLVGGSAMHLRAAQNGFDFLEAQSFATGGWGPDELLRKPGYDEIAKSVTRSHNSFETPCGSYAHMKLTRYLLRATRDGRYGDSMERILHNTVLGALPLQPDGRSFYHSDYNTVGKRVYSGSIWPCCSGTLPQVAADYGINTFLHEPGAVWINLYHPSELRFSHDGKAIAIEQSGGYPHTGNVEIAVRPSQPVALQIHLRIPAWAGDKAVLRLNDTKIPIVTTKGFITVDRVWRTGDKLSLDLSPSLRLEPLPPDLGTTHEKTVALMYGPLVLFALRDAAETGTIALSADALLHAERSGPAEWTVHAPSRTRRFVPFTAVGDRLYSTYISLV